MSKNTTIDGMVDEIMGELEKYSGVVANDMKKAIISAGKMVKKEIGANAPKRTGVYARSWSTRKTKESPTSLQVTIYSKEKYQLAHLLEKGHAKRGGGRVKAFPHIAPAEENAIKKIEKDIKKTISD